MSAKDKRAGAAHDDSPDHEPTDAPSPELEPTTEPADFGDSTAPITESELDQLESIDDDDLVVVEVDPDSVGANPSPECGYIGFRPDPIPASAYALTTGPDAPDIQPDDRTRAVQHSQPHPVETASPDVTEEP
jgi:hypothetical protein